jgi:hypothetical protein
MLKFLALAAVTTFGASLAMADVTGNGSGLGGGPSDPYLFGQSGASPIDLYVATATGQGYLFTTNFDEINAGVFNQGWWSPTLSNLDSNANYYVGTSPEATANDYFTFNMGQNQVIGPIVFAMLAFQMTGTSSLGLPVTYELGSVADSATALADKSANPSAAIYADLGSANYGSFFVANTTNHSNPLKVMLNSTAVADINAVINSNSYFSIGGTIAPDFSIAATLAPRVDPVAEPLSLVLLGTVMIVFTLLFKRKVQA